MSQQSSGCNCPSMDDVMSGPIYTKPPCPIHDTPEAMAHLSSILVPRMDLSELEIRPLEFEADEKDGKR